MEFVIKVFEKTKKNQLKRQKRKEKRERKRNIQKKNEYFDKCQTEVILSCGFVVPTTEDDTKDCMYFHFYENTYGHVQTGFPPLVFLAKGIRITNFSLFNSKLSIKLRYVEFNTGVVKDDCVSLANIFYHNKNLYNELISTPDVTGNTIPGVQVSYDEMPQNVRQLVEEAYLEAKNCTDVNKLVL
jgi:hypothetical protein